MSRAKALFGKVLGPLIFRRATVANIEDISAHFRMLFLEGENLRGVRANAGDKVQVFLGEAGMRTYSPIGWDSETGAMQLLVYVHGASPASEWGRRIQVGDTCQFLGPSRSIAFSDMQGPVVLFGDETSFAVARALALSRSAGQEFECVFEVTEKTESDAVLAKLSLQHAQLVVRSASEAHLQEVARIIVANTTRHPSAPLVLTGRAQSIQTLRARLREHGLRRSGKNKAYWSVGKSGLD